MKNSFEQDLAKRGIEIPNLTPPVANYVPWTRSGHQVFVSGQVSLKDGKLHHAGIVGDLVSLEDGQRSARMAALNVVAYIRDACSGDLSRVKRVLKVNGFVAATARFTDHPKVVNGASDLFVEVFGDLGRHARAAVGVSSLPLGASVEIEAIVEID
jgi:enamine deaminase RidA (YjgF/YER057c/UK114 family)